MPIIIPQDIPAFATLEKENIFVMESERAMTQDIRPIEIAILNLMPTKIETETKTNTEIANSVTSSYPIQMDKPAKSARVL